MSCGTNVTFENTSGGNRGSNVTFDVPLEWCHGRRRCAFGVARPGYNRLKDHNQFVCQAGRGVLMAKSLLLCDCAGTQPVDPAGLSRASGLACSEFYTGLCTHQAEDAARAIAGEDTIVCCAQEQRLFAEMAQEAGVSAPLCLDLRDRAGWSADTASLTPKMAALIAEGILPAPAHKSIDVVSHGLCLVIGAGEVAFAAAAQLAQALGVTVLQTDETEPPPGRDFDVIRGRVRTIGGALGRFELTIDALQQIIPGGRGAFLFTAPRDGARSRCDIVVDLSGDAPLFPAAHKRDGYLRADGGSIGAVSEAVFAASHLVGTFEKPLYVTLEPLLCAHSRAEQTGCTRCLDICPTGAIAPAGDHVRIDPMICAGCGACSSLCPSGAISYDAPPVASTFLRIQTLARAFRKAGGAAPHLLVHDDHGRALIALAARFARGLPASVIPLALDALNAFGHAEMVAALAAGFIRVSVLLAPRTERTALEREAALADAIAGGRIALLDVQDPDALWEALHDAQVPASCGSAPVSPVYPMGTRRQITRQAARALLPDGALVPLPDNAPYGTVVVDKQACTLCLSCVSLCPSGALADNPDRPELRFQEDACLQCGICAKICPERAITYTPRLNLADTALEQIVVHHEAPFACIECGALFGVKSTVDRIVEKLSGKHAMFMNPDAARMIQMCDTCRVNAQYHARDNPFAARPRPAPRTTDDYLDKKPDH